MGVVTEVPLMCFAKSFYTKSTCVSFYTLARVSNLPNVFLTSTIIKTRVRQTLNYVSFTSVAKETRWTCAIVMVKPVMTCASMETRV